MDVCEVCPVDGFDEDDNMRVIHPDEFIDWCVCEPECPPEAIVPVTDPKAEAWLELNRDYSDNNWPNITRKGEAPADADAHRSEEHKYEKYFSNKPGQGDG